VKKVVIGNPLSGRAASSLEEPIVKGTSALYCMTENEAKSKPETACTRCARCLYACPAGLDPAEIANAMTISSKEERLALLKAQNASRCLSCGSCAYVCPSYRPLANTLRLAKQELQEAMHNEKGEHK
jgi:electron transport complex protein RnfC